MKIIMIILAFFTVRLESAEVCQRVNDDIQQIKSAIDTETLPIPDGLSGPLKELWIAAKRDQFVRNQISLERDYSQLEWDCFWHIYPKFWRQIDYENAQMLKKMLENILWFNISDFGKDASMHAFLIIQHADFDLPFQKLILKRLEALVKNGEVEKKHYALLYDRVYSVGMGMPQKYGSQGQCIGTTWKPYKLKDPINVDQLRADMGLEPMADNIARLSTFSCKRGAD